MTKYKLWIAPLLALGLAGAPAFAKTAEHGGSVQSEARIPFVNHGGIRDWRVGDRDTIYIQDRARRWYRAELMGMPISLRSAWAIGFETRGTDTFDRFSNVYVEGRRYPVASLVRIDGPPPPGAARAARRQHGA
jgi:hypothetical protein